MNRLTRLVAMIVAGLLPLLLGHAISAQIGGTGMDSLPGSTCLIINCEDATFPYVIWPGTMLACYTRNSTSFWECYPLSTQSCNHNGSSDERVGTIVGTEGIPCYPKFFYCGPS